MGAWGDLNAYVFEIPVHRMASDSWRRMASDRIEGGLNAYVFEIPVHRIASDSIG